MPTEPTFYTVETENSQPILRLQGDWTVDQAAQFAQTQFPRDAARIDATGIGRMDSWGALKVQQLLHGRTQDAALTDRQRKILDFLPDDFHAPETKPAPFSLYQTFVLLGKGTQEFRETAYGFISLIGQIFVTFLRNLKEPRRFRFHSIVRHIDETGFRALPIIGLLAVLIAMVVSYQAATQLTKFGANIFTVDLTVISLLREMGVLITAIMVAGRSGSAFAAEIGVMKMREEVDALRTMGFDPVEVLILPRLIAMMISLPILAFLADIIGLAGGAAIATLLLDIPLSQYIDRVQSVATPLMFFIGIVKAPVFAFVITLVGAYQGMNVSGSAESVGKLTTLSVVQSIFLVIMIDALFSVLFAQMGL